jgi:hypothetical protein
MPRKESSQIYPLPDPVIVPPPQRYNMLSAPDDYDCDSKTAKQLRVLLEKRKIAAKGLTRKAQLIATLEDHDAILKRERQAEGTGRVKLGLRRMRLEDYRALTNDALDRLATQSKLTVRPSTRARLIDALEKDNIRWRSRSSQTPKQRPCRCVGRNAEAG